MPEATSPTGDSQGLQPDTGVPVPRLKLGEEGFVGLRVIQKRILEESQAAFRYPAFIQTVNEMRNNPTVGAAMNVYRMMISRVKWDVEPPVDATDAEIARTNFVKSVMNDMTHSWSSFIEEVIPYLEYGFDVHEIVLRRRLYRNGSKYNDGLVGLKKLAPRSQDTIQGWVFSEDGSDLLACKQTTRYLQNPTQFASRLDPEDGLVTIDRDKFLLFSASATKGNPEGNSIYKNIYLAFKQLTTLQNQELIGVSKDVQGILKIAIPPQYMAPDATPDQKAALAGFQAIIDNYNAGTQRGLLVPLMLDEHGHALFDYGLLEGKGHAKYDTEGIIRRLQSDILSALSVDVLKLGSDGSGSFSLAEQKSSILALAIDYRLREIAEVLNNHLMVTLYQMNGWDASRAAKFVYSDVQEVSLEELGKFIQRIASTSMIEVDRPVLNRIRVALGVEPLADDEPVDREKLSATLTGQTTAAGDGMAVGTTGQGTAKNATQGANKQDKSASNAHNS